MTGVACGGPGRGQPATAQLPPPSVVGVPPHAASGETPALTNTLPEQRTWLSHIRFLTHRHREIIRVCCFKLLSFRATC